MWLWPPTVVADPDCGYGPSHWLWPLTVWPLAVFLCSSVKRRTNWHRHDYTEPDDGSKPVQAGTAVFISQLQNRSFARYALEPAA